MYEDWKHPAFAGAIAVHYAFEKGLKIHGEQKALAYWESKKAELLQRYQQDIDKIEKELASPLFSCRPDQWKDQARTWAKQDLAKVLNLIQKLKEDAAPKQEPKQETRIPEQRTAKIVQPPINPTEEKYLKFRALHGVLKDNPKAPASFKEDLKRLGKEVSQDKEFMSKIKLLERDEAKKIERIVQEKERTFERDRGGLSM